MGHTRNWRRVQRAFDDDTIAGLLASDCDQAVDILVFADQAAKHLHPLFGEGRFRTAFLRIHRIKVNDIGSIGIAERSKNLDRVGMLERETHAQLREFIIARKAFETIGEKSRDFWRTFQSSYATAVGGHDERVDPETGGGIDDKRTRGALDAESSRERLAFSESVANAMKERGCKKVDRERQNPRIFKISENQSIIGALEREAFHVGCETKKR